MAEGIVKDPMYDRGREVILTDLEIDGKAILCSVSREALSDHFGATNEPQSLINAYSANKAAIDEVLVLAYRENPDAQPEARSGDFLP